MELDERHHQFPVFYFSNPAAVVGPYDEVPISPNCRRFDYELEIAAVIGKPGATIPLDRAEEHIAVHVAVRLERA
ncbi:fumarylacetoacetate hydrolase family protein [Pseudonocardia sp. MCCB 268]|nr:fumarylacetoacetate hydrolase family protein [Pseudonocardia cytotoxica]